MDRYLLDQPVHLCHLNRAFAVCLQSHVCLFYEILSGLVTIPLCGYTPQPLYNTIVGVHSINRVS